MLTNLDVLDSILARPYDATRRPSDNVSGFRTGPADRVIAQLRVNKLWGIDQVKKKFELDGFYRLWWNDSRLVWDPSLAANPIKLLHPCSKVPCNGDALRVWHPNLFWASALQNQVGEDGEGSLFYLHADGSMYQSQRARLSMNCAFHFGKLPFDTQHCLVRLGPYMNNASELDLQWRQDAPGLDFSGSLQSGEWTVSRVTWGRTTYLLEPGNQTYVEACISLRRDSAQYQATFLVAFILVIASYSGFFINPGRRAPYAPHTLHMHAPHVRHTYATRHSPRVSPMSAPCQPYTCMCQPCSHMCVTSMHDHV